MSHAYPMVAFSTLLQRVETQYKHCEKNSSIFSLIGLHLLLSARTCMQENFAPAESPIFTELLTRIMAMY